MKIDIFFCTLREFYRKYLFTILKDHSGEATMEGVECVAKCCASPVVLLIEGIKYIVTSHFKQEGKDAAESAYRLMERELDKSA